MLPLSPAALLHSFWRMRFVRFGLVGASGTGVNLAVLWVAREYLFLPVDSARIRLFLAQVLAILVSTLSNFYWNRRYTWHEAGRQRTGFGMQFAQYALAGWLGIAIQFALTQILATQMHYLLATLLAIGIASLFNYLVNTLWTFRDRSGFDEHENLEEIELPASVLQKSAADTTTTTLELIRLESWADTTWVRLQRMLVPGLGLLLAVFAYVYALDSRNAPTNGDEAVYIHIARLTAESGHWLPLQSELHEMRNTKPPLLFWQGILSTAAGTQWDRLHLRWPSVLYTMLVAVTVLLLTYSVVHVQRNHLLASAGQAPPTVLGDRRRFPRNALSAEVRALSAWRLGMLAALGYLAFFHVYRYGRPFLTSAAETFWCFLPFALLLIVRRGGAIPGRVSFLFSPLLLGLIVGIGLLYKSYALLTPIGFSLALWYGYERVQAARAQIPDPPAQRALAALRAFLCGDLPKLVVLGGVALAVFSLWLVFDPDPSSIVREFILGENLGKFSSENYLRQLLWGGQSVWALALGLLADAGLMAPVLLGLIWISVRYWRSLAWYEHLLWVLVIVWFCVFALPSQRSGRYLLPVLPALAVLMTLRWQQIPRSFFLCTHLLVALGTLLGAALAWQLNQEALQLLPGFSSAVGSAAVSTVSALTSGETRVLYPYSYGLIVVGTLAVCFAGLTRRQWSRDLAPMAAVLFLLVLAGFLRPFDGPLGQFHPALLAQLNSEATTVAVPCSFRGSDESYRFEFPRDVQIQPYQRDDYPSQKALAEQFPYFVLEGDLPSGFCLRCQVLDQRLVVRSRQSNEEIWNKLSEGKLFTLVVGRQQLIASNRARDRLAPQETTEGVTPPAHCN